jgi:3-hydroxyisobutyrate dehydrogenase
MTHKETHLMDKQTTVAILGLGAMGSRMAHNLINAGASVAVYNRSAEKAKPLVDQGAIWAATPREAADQAQFVISMVRDDDASRQVWLAADTGAIRGLKPTAIAIESSTLTPAWVAELAKAVDSTGAAFLDAPVAGSRPQAEAAQLIYMAGGDAAVLKRAEPVLKALGGAIHHAGPSGSGAVIKLMVNALFGVQVAAVAELLGYAQRSGLNAQAALDVLAATPVTSPAAKLAGAAMLAGNFAPMFPVELVEKDFGYASAAAQAVNAQIPVVDAVHAVLQRAVQQGLAQQNLTALAKLYG